MDNLSENAHCVLQERYLLRDRNWALKENPEGMFQRVARSFNLLDSATTEDIAVTYFPAWKCKAKGVTVFRNDSGREGAGLL